jgi:hypothetical protein
VADEPDARGQLAEQLLVEQARYLNAVEGAEDDEDAVQLPAPALVEELGAAFGPGLEQVCQLAQRLP